MSKCEHKNIQDFTEICLDCGRNIYESDSEYEKRLAGEVETLRKQLGKDRISKLEEEKAKLLEQINGPEEDDCW